MKCANKSTLTCCGEVFLQLCIGKQVIEWTFLVIENLAVPLIVGNDIIKNYDIVLRNGQGKFWFGDDQANYFKYDDWFYDKEEDAQKPIVHIKLGNDDDAPNEKIQEDVKNLLKKYPMVAREDGGYGLTDITYHTIEADGLPARSPVRRVSPALRKVIKAQVDKLLEKGMIRPSKSPYAAPVVLDPILNGEYRMCL